jgi:hypothetical protein
MATNRLFQLFDESTKTVKDLVVSSPKTLDDMVAVGAADSTGLSEQIDIVKRVLPKVDYSDFSNFVFFNSALDYFNICGDRFIREWPYAGTYSDQINFLSASDPYQTYLANTWPRWQGCVNFTASGGWSYIQAKDTGLVDGNETTGLLGLGTGSLTIEAHVRIEQMPSAGNAYVIVERAESGSNVPAFSLFVTDTDLSFAINNQVAATIPTTTGSFWVACVFDRSTPTAGTSTMYATLPSNFVGNDFQGNPLLAVQTTGPVAAMDTSAGVLTVGSASNPNLPGFYTPVAPKMQMSELRIWNVAKSQEELFANYNLRVFADTSLITYWRLNEGYTYNSSSVRDYSGHQMNGKIYNANASQFWVSSSFGMSPQDLGEPIIPSSPQLDNTLYAFVTSSQLSASLYDRNNANLITNLVPQQFLYLEDDANTTVLKNLLYLMARQMDELKVKIDQFSKLLTVNYGDFDQTPDALLADALRFWGWDTKGSFLNKEAFQHFFGYDALTPSGSLSGAYAPPAALNNQAQYDNQRLDVMLENIKSEFWKRTLNNLIYIYKTKGTRESIESLLRVYGLDDRLVKVKEFGLKKNVEIQTHRIASEKSFWAYHMSGTNVVETNNQPIPFTGYTTWSTQIRFPTEYAVDWGMFTGSIFHALQSQNGGMLAGPLMMLLGGPQPSVIVAEELMYERSAGTTTGTLVYATYDGTNVEKTSFSGWPIFDGRWYNLMVHRSGTEVLIHVQHLDEDRIDYSVETSGTIVDTIIPGGYDFSMGKHITGVSGSQGSEFWVHNVQVWNMKVNDTEQNDHTLNPFSFGAETPERALNLALNWQFDKDVDTAQGIVWDNTKYENHGVPNLSCSYDRFSRPYNFIAPPDYGWNEEKIRTFETSTSPVDQQWLESNAVSVEFNLIDALNEDISYMLSSMDNWNNLIGDPANRHRDTYPALDRFRQQYFGRLTNRINFRAFADFMDFFDRSFVDIIRKLLPARANFKGAEFVVESHMLERPKVQYTYRRHNPDLVPEGSIVIVGHATGVPEAVKG